jgi:hypothetical protein
MFAFSIFGRRDNTSLLFWGRRAAAHAKKKPPEHETFGAEEGNDKYCHDPSRELSYQRLHFNISIFGRGIYCSVLSFPALRLRCRVKKLAVLEYPSLVVK